MRTKFQESLHHAKILVSVAATLTKGASKCNYHKQKFLASSFLEENCFKKKIKEGINTGYL